MPDRFLFIPYSDGPLLRAIKLAIPEMSFWLTRRFGDPNAQEEEFGLFALGAPISVEKDVKLASDGVLVFDTSTALSAHWRPCDPRFGGAMPATEGYSH